MRSRLTSSRELLVFFGFPLTVRRDSVIMTPRSRKPKVVPGEAKVLFSTLLTHLRYGRRRGVCTARRPYWIQNRQRRWCQDYDTSPSTPVARQSRGLVHRCRQARRQIVNRIGISFLTAEGEQRALCAASLAKRGEVLEHEMAMIGTGNIGARRAFLSGRERVVCTCDPQVYPTSTGRTVRNEGFRYWPVLPAGRWKMRRFRNEG